jgi:hypothetical protein
MKTRKTAYLEHLESTYWHALRKRALERANYQCERFGCGRGNCVLEMHHLHYLTLFHERLEDVEMLCDDCHQRETFRWRPTYEAFGQLDLFAENQNVSQLSKASDTAAAPAARQPAVRYAPDAPWQTRRHTPGQSSAHLPALKSHQSGAPVDHDDAA